MSENATGLTLALPADVVDAIAARAAEILAERQAVDADRWLNVKEAAEYMACKPQRIYDLAGQGRLLGGHDGTRRVFRRSELNAYLEGGRW